MAFPITRMRRLRRNQALRQMVRETSLSTNDLIYPLFIVEDTNQSLEVPSMPGVFRISIDMLQREAEEVAKLNIPAVLLFGIPTNKDELGSGAYADDGIVQRAVRAIKATTPELLVITDVCLCEYTSHGHCGVFHSSFDSSIHQSMDCDVENDATLKLLAKTALSQASAGADMIAPSDMMDGRIGRIRNALDAKGFEDIPIMSYAAKMASAFYGPFRDAAESTPEFGSRHGYQMDFANRREAMREIELDIGEGADIVMVKPGLSNLDLVREARERFDLPLAVYNVSGEYAMIKAAAANGWLDEERVVDEVLIAFKRAGADLILTYFAKDVARRLQSGA